MLASLFDSVAIYGIRRAGIILLDPTIVGRLQHLFPHEDNGGRQNQCQGRKQNYKAYAEAFFERHHLTARLIEKHFCKDTHRQFPVKSVSEQPPGEGISLLIWGWNDVNNYNTQKPA